MKHYLLIAMFMLSPISVSAADPGALEDSQIDEATKSMEQAAQNLSNILGLILRSIPQFEAPVILENGDILIRRVHNKNENPTPEKNPERPKI